MARPGDHFDEKKEMLIKTAFDLFLDKGYENTTISDITKQAGITRAGAYHYFTSREELLDLAIDYGISRDVEQTCREMTGLSVREKMMLFTRGAGTPNEMVDKLRSYRFLHKDSYASYRIRERSIHAYIPILESIIREGIDEGIYQTDYPRQAAEYMVLLVKAVAESNLLPETDAQGMRHRIEALLQIMKLWLHADDESLADFTELFNEELTKKENDIGSND